MLKALRASNLGAIAIAVASAGLVYWLVQPDSTPPVPEVVVNLGQMTQGEAISTRAVLSNASANDIRIVGAGSLCSCIGIVKTAKLLPARGQASLDLRILPSQAGRFSQEVTVYLDSPHQHSSAVRVVGFAVHPQTENDNG